MAPHTTPLGDPNHPVTDPDRQHHHQSQEPGDQRRSRGAERGAQRGSPRAAQGPAPRAALTELSLPRTQRRGRQARVDQIAAFIAARIADGTWAGDKFPTMTYMSRTLRIGLSYISDALQQLKADRVVHKVKVVRPPGQKGRIPVWRPTSVASEEPADVSAELEAGIRSGRLTGELPAISAMAREHRVNDPVIRAMYLRLQRDGVIDKVWLPDLSRRVWYVVADLDEGTRRRMHRGDCKALAIAQDLVRRMPEWLVRAPGGKWHRTALPSFDVLVEEYRTHYFNVKLALELLVRLRILDRPLADPKVHMPRPPADGGASHHVVFRTSGAVLSRDWYPVADTVEWPAIPLHKDHEVFADIDDPHARSRARRRSAQR